MTLDLSQRGCGEVLFNSQNSPRGYDSGIYTPWMY